MSTNSSNPYQAPQMPTGHPEGTWTPPPNFRDLRLRSQFFAMIGAALLICQLLLCLSYFLASQKAVGAPPIEGVNLYFNVILSPVSLCYFGLSIAMGVSYFFWIVAAYRNLPALAFPHRSTNPTRVVLGYFIPLYNFIQPYLVLQEIWVASDPQQIPRKGHILPRNKSQQLAFAWWGMVIVWGVLFYRGWKIGRTGTMSSTLLDQAIFHSVGILDTAFYAILVLVVSAKQSLRHGFLQQDSETTVAQIRDAEEEIVWAQVVGETFATQIEDVVREFPNMTEKFEVFEENGSDRAGETVAMVDVLGLEDLEVLDDPVETAKDPPSHAQNDAQVQRQPPPKQTPGADDIWDKWPGQG